MPSMPMKLKFSIRATIRTKLIDTGLTITKQLRRGRGNGNGRGGGPVA